MSSFSSEKQKHVSFNDYKRKFLISDELERSACSSWNPFLYPFKETFNEIWKYSSQVGGIAVFWGSTSPYQCQENIPWKKSEDM